MRLLLLLLLLLSPTTVRGSAVGTIFSGPTSADAASVYWNPAAMTLLHGTHGMLFGAIVPIRAHYQRDTNDPYTNQPFAKADLSVLKPDLAPFVVTDAGLRRFRFGFGVAIPVIDGATWELEYEGRPSSTRYHAVNARLAQFMFGPAVGFEINRYISVGLGLDVVGMWVTQTVMTDMSARVNQMACAMGGKAPACPLDAPLARENPAFDARTDVDGVGWSAGVSGGVLVTPHPSLRLGLTVHSGGLGMKVPVKMKVEIPPSVTDWVGRNLPSLELPELSADGELDVASPTIIGAGIVYLPTRRLELAADLHWINKSRISVMLGNVTRATNALIASQVLVKAVRDDYLAGLRVAYQLLPSLRLALRLEYGNNTRPDIYTTAVSLDFHKISAHAGVAWQVHRRVALYLEYGHFFILDRTIRRSLFQPNASPSTPEEEGLDKPLPTGHYSAESDRVGAGLTLHF